MREASGGRGLLAVFLLALAAGVGILFLWGNPASGAVNLPDGFNRSRIAGGLTNPTAMALAPGGRILVTQQNGRLRVIQDGRLLRRAVTRFEVDSDGERGLLGVAVDPEFSRNHLVYVYYTARTTPRHNRVARFKIRGNRAVPGSRKIILRLDNLSMARNHNGGAIHFGVGGKLYVAVGDNNDGQNAQTLGNLKGKLLRINRDGSVPSTNPFYDQASGKNRAIWALGLRNPYSFAVQQRTGAIFVNDVGEQTWEEINRGRAGANYGWPNFEGPENEADFTPPVFAYRHDGARATTGCAITGGAFYAPVRRDFPRSYVGDYLFADFCSGWIRRYDPRSDRTMNFVRGLQNPVDLLAGPGGSLLYLERGTGSVNKIRYGR